MRMKSGLLILGIRMLFLAYDSSCLSLSLLFAGINFARSLVTVYLQAVVRYLSI